MGFAGCLSPDSPYENCNCFYCCLHICPFFYFIFYFIFILLLLHILLLLKLFSTSFPFSSALFCFFLLYGTCVQTVLFQVPEHSGAESYLPVYPPSIRFRSIVLLINPRTATLVPERPTTPLDPQANVRKFGVTRTHTSRVKNKAKEQRRLIACTRRTIVFSLLPHKAGRKPSDTESAGACPSRWLHLGRRRTHASTEGLAVPPLNELS